MSQFSQAIKNNAENIQEYWTSKQKMSHSLHYSISYRASFKAELPNYFIQNYLVGKNKTVFDPFGGRGTTMLESNILGHKSIHNDINKLSLEIAKGFKYIPSLEEIKNELDKLDLAKDFTLNEYEVKNLLPFFHEKTLKEIINLKNILNENKENETLNFIKMISLSRLHGHSEGFFSVYTFPQFSITPESQNKNNIKRNSFPVYKEIKSRILNKARKVLKDSLNPFHHEFSKFNQYTNDDSRNLNSIASKSVDLIITSPPFLDKVNYLQDNWLRMWFCGIEENTTNISCFSNISEWTRFIHESLIEFSRVLKKNSYLVLEVGEVTQNKKTIYLDENVISSSKNTGLEYIETIINGGKFTKLSNCFGATNNEKGTNTNRCVIFRNKKN